MRTYFAVLLCLALVGCPRDIDEALRSYGYTPVRPASSFWLPGSVVYLKSRRPLEVGFICTASQMMGPSYAPLESTSTNADLQRATKRGLRLGAQFQDIVSGDAELENVKSLTMTVRNVHLYEVTDYDVMTAAKTPNRRCLAAIARRRAQGYDVTIISGAIMADVAYEIGWKRSTKMDAQAKIAAAQNLSAKLGVDASSVSDKSIQASKLIWGIRADDFLAAVLAPEILPPADRGSKVFDPATVSNIEAFVAGTEPRSMPTTPAGEQRPFSWAPLPVPPPDLKVKVEEAELAATAMGDPNQIAASPPQPAQVDVDVPADPNAPLPVIPAAPPNTDPNEPAPLTLSQERLDELMQLYGEDWDGEND